MDKTNEQAADKAAADKAAADKAAADKAAADKAKTHDPETGIPYYHKMRLSSDTVTAAGLRNGMTPAQVDEAVNRVLGGKLP